MTQIYGYAIPIVVNVADHTWAYAEDGFCCACPDTYARGCSEEDRRNGRIITHGDAVVAKGRCMAGTIQTWLFIPLQCGVTYAINGVCHQMTNRILLSTGDVRVNVALAAGAVASYLNYGPWGTNVPPAAFLVNAIIAGILTAKAAVEFVARCAGCGIISPIAYDATALARIPITAEIGASLADNQRMILAEEAYVHAKQQIDEVGTLLAGRAPESQIDRVKQIYAEYHRPNRDLLLGSSGHAAIPTPEELALRIDAANALAQQPLTQCANTLSETEFQNVFGHPRDVQVPLIERDILLSALARPEGPAPRPQAQP